MKGRCRASVLGVLLAGATIGPQVTRAQPDDAVDAADGGPASEEGDAAPSERGEEEEADRAPASSAEEPGPRTDDGADTASEDTEEGETGQAPPPAIAPPELSEFVEAAYPPEAEAEGLEAAVILELTIAADGTVTEATVAEGAGHGFDEAAVEAARRFRFEPARQNGEPIPVRIRYRYVFELEDLEEGGEDDAIVDAPPPPETGRLAGRVLTAEDGEPSSYVTVTLTGETIDGSRSQVTTEEGRFRFDDLPPGAYQLRLEGEGLGDLRSTEEVLAGEETDVTYRLTLGPVDEDQESDFGARAVVEAPPREVTRRTIEGEVLTQVPGTRGDALRAVELLPGVGRPSFGTGALIVRGAAPGDSVALLEGIPVPLLYHFGGLTSFFNSHLLDRIDFYPGNFSARYGRRTGGILDVGVRDPATDRWRGMAELGVIDTWALAEGPIGDDVSVAIGLRRSIIDLIFNALLADTDIQVTTAPVYNDYQAIISYHPDERDTVRVMTYGSSDRFEIFLNDSLGDDPDVRGNAALRTRFHFTQLTWEREFNDRIRQDLNFAIGPTKFQFRLGSDLFFLGDFIDTTLRSEWQFKISDAVTLIAGTDSRLLPFDIRFQGPPPRQTEGEGTDQEPLSAQERVAVNVDGVNFRPALFFESAFQLGDLRMVLGIRADYYSELAELSFDPRSVFRYQVSESLSLKAGAGLYSQPPEFQESSADVGNPDLDPIRSLHTSFGGDYDFLNGMTLGLEGFFKYLWDRPVSTENGVEPFFVSEGVGRIYGLEVAGRINPRDDRDYYGFLSYTLSRSERQDRPGEPWRLFDFDQTHILTLSYTHELPRNWQLGGTLRIVSGNPYTPVVAAVNDLSEGVYVPISGLVNSLRNPVFHRLDVRVQKTWTWDHFKLVLFLDIQNTYNQQNQEGIIYNFNYSESTPINGLPIIPALGIRGEL